MSQYPRDGNGVLLILAHHPCRPKTSEEASSIPVVWTIAGSDPTGGAGIQADVRAITGLGAYACTVLTSITSQNTSTVSHVLNLNGDDIVNQINALLHARNGEFRPCAIKIGMLGNTEQIHALVKILPQLEGNDGEVPIIADPVFKSSSGYWLLEESALDVYRDEVLPAVHLLTPNLFEAELLARRTIRTPEDVEFAADAIIELGAQSVLIKGGHASGSDDAHQTCSDYWTNGKARAWLHSPRSRTPRRGTGCTLASAIAASRALGWSEVDSLVIAKTWINAYIAGPLSEDSSLSQLPTLTSGSQPVPLPASFPSCGPKPLGFYPIVDRASWVRRLVSWGVSTIQLRIKDLRGEELEREIDEAVALTRGTHCRLFINDYWELALRAGAYGVHLGQEDLQERSETELASILKAGVRLGLSTHCFEEVARALAYRPSYIATGPIYHTTLKAMKFKPQGLEALAMWRGLVPSEIPIVAIGGITLEKAPNVLNAGADAIAVVSDITQNSDPEPRTREWLKLF